MGIAGADMRRWRGYNLGAKNMSDPLYLSLWFTGFEADEMLPHAVGVLRQFPFSAAQPGVTYVSVQPMDWSEASIFERRFLSAALPEEAAGQLEEFAHEDYAIIFECWWDLWSSPESDASEWLLRPSRVQIMVHGKQFDEATYTELGHIQADFGLDSAFLHEELSLDATAEEHIRANIAKLLGFTQKVEKNCKLTGRLLWSESEESLAQKLVARLQGVQ